MKRSRLLKGDEPSTPVAVMLWQLQMHAGRHVHYRHVETAGRNLVIEAVGVHVPLWDADFSWIKTAAGMSCSNGDWGSILPVYGAACKAGNCKAAGAIETRVGVKPWLYGRHRVYPGMSLLLDGERVHCTSFRGEHVIGCVYFTPAEIEAGRVIDSLAGDVVSPARVKRRYRLSREDFKQAWAIVSNSDIRVNSTVAHDSLD